MNINMMLHLRKFLSPEIVYGEDAVKLSGIHAKKLGATKVLIVTDPGVRRAGWVCPVENSLKKMNIPYVIFDTVTANPKDHEVMQGAEICIEEACDLIVAVGGGSPMDCAKGIGVVTENPGSILEYEGIDMVPNPSPPLIFIPTTAGSSADVSQFAIITDTDRNVKIAIISKMVIPDIALIDPGTTLTVPRELTARTGMDALCHAFEAYVSKASSPITDMAAINAVEIISDTLLEAYKNPDNAMFREKMMMASLMAGLAFSNANLGLAHSMAHSLGGALGMQHGECNAMLLEKVTEFNYRASEKKYDRLAKAMRLNIDDIEQGRRGQVIASQIAGLREKLGISQKLIDFGVKASDIPSLSQFAFRDPCLATNPREAGVLEIENIYQQIWK